MDLCVLRVRLTKEDYRAFQRAAIAHASSSDSRWRWLLTWPLWLVIGLAAAWASDDLDRRIPLWWVLGGFILALIVGALGRRRFTLPPDSRFFADHRIICDAAGVQVLSADLSSNIGWTAVQGITATGHHVFVWLDHAQAVIIPLTALPPALSASDFAETLERWRVAATSEGAALTPGIEPPSPVTGQRTQRSWWALIARMLLFRNVSQLGPYPPPTWLLVLAAACALMLWAAIDRLSAGNDALFSLYGLPGIAWYALIALAVAAILATQSQPAVAMRVTLLATSLGVYAVLLAVLMATQLPLADSVAMILQALALAYALGIAMHTTRCVSGRMQFPALAKAVVTLLVAGILSHQTYIETHLWYDNPLADEDALDAAELGIENEQLMFDQPARIDAVIEQLPDSDPDTSDVYFVGFAGYGEERVFAEEIKLAARIVEQRYATSDRELLLINDRRDTGTHPIASVTTLRYALRRLATKMDVQNDILFLALSSHGSEDELAVVNGSLPLMGLTDAQLAAALDEAGFRWRVIVISACHAGSFIDKLQDPRTIVITAAAPDRTSFGCSDERELTYFGEAFYRDALPQAATLREAFERARTAIAERERQEEIDASEPQAHFGEVMEDKMYTHSPPVQ